MTIQKRSVASGILVALLSLCFPWTSWPAATERSLAETSFGTVAVYRPEEKPKGLVLLLSDADGWNGRMEKTAEAVADLDYVVVGIGLPSYLKALESGSPKCVDPGQLLLDSALALAKKNGIPSGRAPLLLGFGQGAAVTYATLAASPPATIHAGLSVNFCPRLPLTTPLCDQGSLRSESDGRSSRLLPGPGPGDGWFVFQAPGYCDPEAKAFVAKLNHARWIEAGSADLEPGTGEPDRSLLLALLEWLDPGLAGQVRTQSSLQDLPLHEIPATSNRDDRLAVMLSGDGGWAALDRELAKQLAERGVAVVGWDSLSYYWTAKTPDQAAADLVRVLRRYLDAWHKSKIVLIGFSFGADVLPFLANRLPADLREKLDKIVFLGLSHQATFEFRLSDWIAPASSGQPTLPETARLQGVRRLCIYGADEPDSACPGMAPQGGQVFKVPGGHHFDDDYALLAGKILETGD